VSQPKSYDVAVVGAGVFGAWTAYFLRKSGLSVFLIDSYGAANSRASSGGESRIIRMGYGRDEIYTRWSMRALPLWKKLLEEAASPHLFNPTGVLWIAFDGDPYALASLENLEKTGAKFEELSNAELRHRYPQVCFDDDAWGILEPESGVLMARRAVHAVVKQARQMGVDHRILAAEPPAGSARLETLKDSEGNHIHARTYVFACGPWLSKIFPGVLGNRIFVSRQEVFFFGTPRGDAQFESPAMPTWLALRDEFYGIPSLEARGFKVAHDRHGPPVDPDTQSRVPTPENLSVAKEFLARRFPALTNAPLVEARVCQYENTSNGDFLVDKHPDFENVWLVGGGSGHGFKHGPSLGEYVAACIIEGGAPDERFLLATKDTVQRREIL
jgi:monomeric sarcosine oxidase